MEIFNKEFLLTYQGRISRQPFWMYILAVIAATILTGIVDGVLGTKGVFGLILNLALIYPGICVQIKRWHDRGKSGWWVLINLIPVIGWIWALVECGFMAGTPGSNPYGEDPLAAAGSGAPAA